MIRTWRLDTPAQTLVLATRDERPPEVVHWGEPLPTGEDLAALAEALRPAASGGMADDPGAVRVLPDPMRGDPGAPTLAVVGSAPDFRFEREAWDGEALTLVYLDAASGLHWSLIAEVFADSDVLSLSARLEGPSTAPRRFTAPVVALPEGAARILVFTGRWCGEFQIERRTIPQGLTAFEARGGRTGP